MTDRAKPGRPPPLTERREAFAKKQSEKGKGVFAGQEPRGTGPANRHGMPQLPVGQREVKNWPVLDLGVHPDIAKEEWRLTIDGLVARETELSFADLMKLPQIEDESDFHCVTTWSRFDMKFGGVRFADVMAHVGVKPAATHLFVTAYDRDPASGEAYTTNLTLEEAMKPSVMLVHSWDGAPLPREHGGPVRMVTPELYAWKGAKWIRRITLRDYDERGFWENRGYSNTAHPWFEDRYSRRS